MCWWSMSGKIISNTFIRKEVTHRKKAGPRYTYIYKCLDCDEEIKIRSDYKNHSGKCQSCSHVKLPFESVYNRLRKSHRKLEVNLTYKEYLEFTKIENCYYCFQKIPWNKYATINGKFISSSYFLDRKDNTLGYSTDNCVQCCTRCNRARSNKYTYEEWYGMTEYFRKLKG